MRLGKCALGILRLRLRMTATVRTMTEKPDMRKLIHALRIALTALVAAALVLVAACVELPGPVRHDPPFDAPPSEYDVVVIGAGLGGLSAAATLAKGGLSVLLLEQHHKVGGCATSFSRGGYNFEASVHEITGGGDPETSLGRILDHLDVLDKVDFHPAPDLYRSVFPGVDFTVPQGWEASKKAFIDRWPEEREGIERFYDLCMKVHTQMRSLSGLYRRYGLDRLATYCKVPFKQWDFARNMGRTLEEVLDDHFTSVELKAVMSQLWVYYGPPPSDLWAPEFLVANTSYLVEGAWTVRASSQALSDAFAERIRELGGTIHTGERAVKIDVVNNRAVAVETEHGSRYTCRYVVSNANPYATFFEMIGEEKFPARFVRKFKSYKPANSLFGVYMGLDVTPAELGFTDYEVFYNASLDPEKNYENMMAGRYDRGACTITCYTNLGDPWYHPEGKAVIVLHAYADIDSWPTEREAYRTQKKEAARKLISLAENVIPGLSEHIVVQEEITPLSLKSFTLNHRGSPYGLYMSPDQSRILMEHTTPIDNLYVANNATGVRHGISTAQLNGFRAGNVILDREARP